MRPNDALHFWQQRANAAEKQKHAILHAYALGRRDQVIEAHPFLDKRDGDRRRELPAIQLQRWQLEAEEARREHMIVREAYAQGRIYGICDEHPELRACDQETRTTTAA